MASIAVISEPLDDRQLAGRAAELAASLGLPIAATDEQEHDMLLTLTPDRLELREVSGPAVWAEFTTGRLRHRVDSPGQGASMLRRAVGYRGGRWRVVDATAGLCRDAFLLASAGCDVIAIERSPVIATLVEDGLSRARAAIDDVTVLGRLSLVVADARDWLAQVGADADCADGQIDAVYLDPMFPERTKSALVKKEMRICRRVAGEDPDAVELLNVARRVARSRVAVKRPSHAPPLADGVAFSLPGRTIRYDVYLPTRI